MLAAPLMGQPTLEQYREWTRRYAARRRERGERQVTVWVPESRVEDVKDYAEKLRAEAESRKTKRPRKISGAK